MNGIILTGEELEPLFDLPHACMRLYVFLRTRMDYAPGRAGALHAAISWQAITEYLYVPGRPGMAVLKVSRWQAMRINDHLVKAGLVVMQSNPASGRLIFLLPKAKRDSFGQKKPAPKPQGFPQGSNGHHSIGKNGDLSTQSRKGTVPKAAQHQLTVDSHNAAAATIATSGAADIVLPQALDCLSNSQRSALILTARAKGNPACQKVVDELAGMVAMGKVRNPMALFKRLLADLDEGSFIPSHADRIAAERELANVQREMGAKP